MMRGPLLAGLLYVASLAPAVHADDVHHRPALLYQFAAEHLEVHEGGKFRWDVRAWAGSEVQRLMLRSRSEREHGRTSDGEIEAGWQHAIGTWWDATIGWRGSERPGPRRDWLMLGLRGLAPWFVEVDAMLYLSDAGHGEVRLEAGYELPLTQRLILAADVELRANLREDPRRLAGSGLHAAGFELRLRHEFTRKFAPYVGAVAEHRFGDSRKLARTAGMRTSEIQLLAGVMLWY